MSVFDPDVIARYRAEGHWGDRTLPAFFAETAARVPDRVAMVDPPNRADFFDGAPRRLTHRAMQAEIEGYARALAAHGVKPGSVVAVQLPNIAETLTLYLAVAALGAVVSPVPMAYRAGELKAMAEIVDFDAYVGVTRFKGRAHLAERLPALAAGTRVFALGEGRPDGAGALAPADGPGLAGPVGSPDDLFAIVWTSGTEGRPKAVPKTHNNMMASSLGAWRLLNLPDGANVLAPFPLVNAAALGGLMMCWMRTAGAMLLHQPFDLDTFLAQLASGEVDYTMVAPTLLVRLKERAADPAFRRSLKGLRALGTGAAPPDPEVFAFYQEELGIPVLNFFGSNEGAQLCAGPDRVPDPRRRAVFFPRDGDVGWDAGKGRITANGGIFRLVDRDTGETVTEPGAVGEMRIAGPALMPGYVTRRGFDRSRFDADGFFMTGDLFEIAEEPDLIRFHARAREIISRGGMKISPAELDAFLGAFPGVREAAVAAYACPQYGERVCAFLVMEDGARPSVKDVAEFCDRGGLARFKWPERLEILEALPRNPLMKIDRKALARRLAGKEPADA